MNSIVLVGGGLILLAIALFGTIPIFSFYWFPPAGRAILNTMAALCGFAAFACGFAILTGVEFLLSQGTWAAAFVLVFTVCLYAFEAALIVDIKRNRLDDDPPDGHDDP